jgi:hypothetical protein
MIAETGRCFNFLAPYVIPWLLIVRFTSIRPMNRVIIASLVGGAFFGTLSFLDDYEQGFCCREYSATIWTEKWDLPRNVFGWGLIGAVPLSVIEFAMAGVRKWRFWRKS